MSNRNLPKLPIGTIVGEKYRVERYVGDGGMGQVVAARHLVLNELFAIKFMHQKDLSNPQAATRFIREAQAVVKLKNNEHVARVHDVGKHDTGDLYIVMELLVGQDLGDVLKNRGTLPIHEACSYVLQACNALIEAHDLGIIHRDLKPANLFLTHRKDGSPCIKVLDFGISKILSNADQASDIDMTGTREMMGSPLYMSPEQAKSSRDVDARTDIWALGAILYKLLTGKAPFMGQSMAEISFALLESTSVRPASEIRRDIPAQLDACILRCLEKNIHRRYRRIEDLMVALTPFASPQSKRLVDEDNTATVLQPIRNTRRNHTEPAGPLPLRDAKKRMHERSETDVMPAYRPSLDVRKELARPSHGILTQKTQPLDGHALRAAVRANRQQERKLDFTERVHLPPIASQTPIPSSAPSSATPAAASFQLRASFQVPTIMPPPIPPTLPAVAHPNAPARMTQQPISVTLSRAPDTLEPPWQQRTASKRTDAHGHGILISIVVIAGIGALGTAAFLAMKPSEKLTRAADSTNNMAPASITSTMKNPPGPVKATTSSSSGKTIENKSK